MDKIAYLGTFISLILGLAVANVLRHVAGLVKEGARTDWYWIHTAWSVVLFLALAGEWWLLLQWENVGAISFFAYLMLLVKPSLLFVASDLLFPDRAEGGMLDLRAHFYRVRRSVFVVALIFPFADIADSLLKGWQHVQDLGWPYLGSMVGAIAAGTAGVLSANERLHAALVLFVLVIMIGGMVSALAYVQ